MLENKLNCDPEFVMAYLNNGFGVATLLITNEKIEEHELGERLRGLLLLAKN